MIPPNMIRLLPLFTFVLPDNIALEYLSSFGVLQAGVLHQNQIWTGVDGHIQEKKLEIYHLMWMPFMPAVK